MQSKGFGDVVVRAEVESDDLVDLLRFCREHENQTLILLRAQLLANIIAAESGKHDVQDNQAGTMFLNGIERLVATRAGLDDKAFTGEKFHQAKTDIRVVFYYQQFWFHR